MNKLREAAQAVVSIVTWRVDDVPPHLEFLKEMVKAVKNLKDALAEDRLDEMQALTESEYRAPEYELVGRFTGTLNGRFIFAPESNEIWPVGTALYARVEK